MRILTVPLERRDGGLLRRRSRELGGRGGDARGGGASTGSDEHGSDGYRNNHKVTTTSLLESVAETKNESFHSPSKGAKMEAAFKF